MITLLVLHLMYKNRGYTMQNVQKQPLLQHLHGLLENKIDCQGGLSQDKKTGEYFARSTNAYEAVSNQVELGTKCQQGQREDARNT